MKRSIISIVLTICFLFLDKITLTLFYLLHFVTSEDLSGIMIIPGYIFFIILMLSPVFAIFSLIKEKIFIARIISYSSLAIWIFAAFKLFYL
ncbi:MAG: hypothetical protein A3I32_00015 [Candidatus Yanofskybacteria bacterium RIFCSPLOWO2_02_FULL_45_10]|uniref:Uncharacterized protein n=1 Tax=Candidatus Yanofskybacteria bacterium RIFCSPLOWO2_02_FULL_45_10 TaxID=1802706 RepID=A0A1F8H5S8_9BACT|nr:MAG: hypothetical protein A3I32_00015 [Candidatus Yanofskybacteria bacterium RIFCSPLOWO2_02_FULL_45_10]